MAKKQEVYGLKAVAAKLGIPERRLRYLLDEGQVHDPSMIIGRNRVFTLEAVRELDSFLKAHGIRRAKRGAAK